MTFEEFIQDVLGADEAANYSQEQLEVIYNVHITAANFIYKKWIEDRVAIKKKLNELEKC